MNEKNRRSTEANKYGIKLMKSFFAENGEKIDKYVKVVDTLKTVDSKAKVEDFWGDVIEEENGTAKDDYDYIRICVSRDKVVWEDYFRPKGSVEPVEQSRLTIEGIDEVAELICALNVDIEDTDEILGNLWNALTMFAIKHNINSCYDFIPFLDNFNIEYEKGWSQLLF